MNSTTRQSSEHEVSREPDSSDSEIKKRTWRRIGITALTAVALIGGSIGIAEIGFSNDVMARMPKITTDTVDPKIQSVEIGPNSHLRSGHDVQNGDEANLYRSLDETITITAKNMVTNNEGDNGEWVKVPFDAIKQQDSDFVLKNNSGIPVDTNGAEIWVNHQGAKITRSEAPTSTK